MVGALMRVRNVQDFDAMVRYRPLIALACRPAARNRRRLSTAQVQKKNMQEVPT